MIAITGATGFIGSALVRELGMAGVPMTVVARAPFRAWEGTPARVFAGNLREESFLRYALEGATAIVHLAGRAHFVRDRAADRELEFHEANVSLTERLANAAIHAGVKRFVFISSVAAASGDTASILDDDVFAAPQSPYGRSKRAAELLLARHHASGSLDCVSLRPPAVYGPGARGNPLRLMQLVKRGIPLPFGALSGRRSFVAVQNLVAAIRAAITMPRPDERPFFVDDGTVLTTPEFVKLMERPLGRRARLLSVPLPLLRLAGIVGSTVEQLLPVSVPVTQYEIDRLAGSLVVNGDRFRNAAAFRPPLTPQQAMYEAAEWLVRSAHPEIVAPHPYRT